MLGQQVGQQRSHVAPPEPGWSGYAQVAGRGGAALRNHTFGFFQVAQNAIGFVQEDAPLGSERKTPGRSYKQFDAQSGFEGVESPAYYRRDDALGAGCRREAAQGGSGDEGFELLEAGHDK